MGFIKVVLSVLIVVQLNTITVASAKNFNPTTKVLGDYCKTLSRCLDPMFVNGIVVSPNYMATQAGTEILEKGGNAVDAAIAVASTLAVVYPQMNSIGGDNFWLIYNAKTGELRGLNASGRSGSRVTIDAYKAKGLMAIPHRGYLSANTVPGVVSGWDEAYQYAKKTMDNSLPWKDLLARSIFYASSGFPVTPSVNYWSEIDNDPSDKEFRGLQRFSEFKRIFLKPDGDSYHIGETMKQPDLAKSLTLIANQGADVFYKGQIAKDIISDLQAHGGLLTLQDFANHKASWVNPIHVPYHEYVAYNLPPNSQGVTSLEILNILNNFDLQKFGEGTPDYYHVIVEATKQAFADRDKYITDPEFNHIPLDFLLSKKHGQDQAAHIDMRKAAEMVKPLDPKGDTVWFGVIDKQGNAVSVIQSIYYDFGSGIVAKNTGILLQNRGSYFSLDPKNVNHLEPNKRTFHTLNPAMLFRNGKPYLIYGTMGGEGQPQTQAALVTRIVDFGMSPQEAIDAPRWLLGRTWGRETDDLKIEGRVNKTVTNELKKRGQNIEVVRGYTDVMGHAGVILIDQSDKVMFGASDPRGDGAVMGY